MLPHVTFAGPCREMTAWARVLTFAVRNSRKVCTWYESKPEAPNTTIPNGCPLLALHACNAVVVTVLVTVDVLVVVAVLVTDVLEVLVIVVVDDVVAVDDDVVVAVEVEVEVRVVVLVEVLVVLPVLVAVEERVVVKVEVDVVVAEVVDVVVDVLVTVDVEVVDTVDVEVVDTVVVDVVDCVEVLLVVPVVVTVDVAVDVGDEKTTTNTSGSNVIGIPGISTGKLWDETLFCIVVIVALTTKKSRFWGTKRSTKVPLRLTVTVPQTTYAAFINSTLLVMAT
jgi:hypothetical protein